jgi:hypothetical protein
MPRLVEEAGGELAAGQFFKAVRWAGLSSRTSELAGRTVTLTLTPGGVAVSHR